MTCYIQSGTVNHEYYSVSSILRIHSLKGIIIIIKKNEERIVLHKLVEEQEEEES